MIEACVSPANTNRKETLNTLKYANHARNIQNKAVVSILSTYFIGSINCWTVFVGLLDPIFLRVWSWIWQCNYYFILFCITCQILQRRTEKASMSTKSCIDCREKVEKIRDLKEKVAKLEMEKAEPIHSRVSAWLSMFFTCWIMLYMISSHILLVNCFYCCSFFFFFWYFTGWIILYMILGLQELL